MLFDKMKSEDKELIKSSNKIQKGLASIFCGKKLDESMLEELEELLITSDLNSKIVEDILCFIKNNKYTNDITIDNIKSIIFEKLNFIIKDSNLDIDFNKKPYVIMLLGVNGSGKTTIIGKIANRLKNNGKKVLLAACDTFRAGATEQLEFWANKIGVDIIKKDKENEEPASLAYKGYIKAKSENYDFLIIDTAGRMQNNINLIEELAKIDRVLKKIDNSIPHQNIIVLDATIGQNSFRQFEIFQKIINIDSIIMNKLDSTSKGGILISIIDKFKKPIFAIGVGEKIDDIKDFDNKKFLYNLLGL